MENNMLLPKKLIQKCPICGQEYNHNKIKILESEDLYILSYLKCASCNSGLVLKILMLPHGMVGQAIVTELDEEELIDIKKNNQPIASEDVLFIYDFFKKGEVLFSGALTKEKNLVKEIK